MSRRKKLFYNTVVSLIYQIVAFVCGFILPKYFLTYYGSSVNGLVSSITQFLGFITLAEAGVGAVVQSALYKPLADRDNEQISRIMISSDRFFRMVGFILIAYTAILMVSYPFVAIKQFSFLYTMSLIFAISLSSFAQYFFCMSYRLLLNADQLAFIPMGLQGITTLLSTVLSVVLMKLGFNVQAVKLGASLLFMIQPLFLTWYVKKHYYLNRSIQLHGEPISQKWNGLAQHIAAVVLGNTDVVVLTLFSTLENVSVYAVYSMVVRGINSLISSLTTGLQSLFGNMYAKGEQEALEKTFAKSEWLNHTFVVFCFFCTGKLLLPFIQIYTSSIHDADYYVPIFAVLITLAYGAYCIRTPYVVMVLAAGHYKQTQVSAIIESVLNVIVSVVFVFKFGLVGVAVGTLVAMIYRTSYLAWYLSKAIIYREFKYYIKHMIVDIITLCVGTISAYWIRLYSVSYVSWIFMAIETAGIILIVSFAVNFIFYKDYVIDLYSEIQRRILTMLRKIIGGV